jgi:Peptidase family M28
LSPKIAQIFLCLFLLLASTACVLLKKHPLAPLSGNAPATEFSGERAMLHLWNFAQRPHPVGSAEHDRARDYLVNALTRLGLPPEIQRTTGVTACYMVAGAVENIVARLKGSAGSSGAVLLSAHYDSVPAGPGAGDDGSGVVTLLETIRVLRAGLPLRNDVVVLFTDGEEEGLLGASAFMAEHPWARDMRIALINHRRLSKLYAWEEMKNKTSWGAQTVDYEKIAAVAVQAMKPAGLNRFLVVCALVSDLYCPGYNPRQSLEKTRTSHARLRATRSILQR